MKRWRASTVLSIDLALTPGTHLGVYEVTAAIGEGGMGQVFRACDTVTDTLAAVLTRDIEWHRLPPATPPTLRRVLSRCLERDPKSRLRDIGDVKADLDPASTADPGQPKPQAGWNGRWRLVPWALTAGALVMTGWMA
jgi:serine/threonine protein kinase